MPHAKSRFATRRDVRVVEFSCRHKKYRGPDGCGRFVDSAPAEVSRLRTAGHGRRVVQPGPTECALQIGVSGDGAFLVGYRWWVRC